VQNINSKPKAFWQYINWRLKIRPSISELLSISELRRIASGSVESSDSEMATLFNDYFSSVFTVEDTTVIPTLLYLLLIYIIDFNPKIVFNKVMNLPSDKSPSPRWLTNSINKLVNLCCSNINYIYQVI